MLKPLFFILSIFTVKLCSSQSYDTCCTRTVLSHSRDTSHPPEISKNNARIWLLPRTKKNFGIAILFANDTAVSNQVLPVSEPGPLIKVHGNVLYNFSYRSYLDTPFAQTGLMQHQVLTTLNLTLKNKYPLQVQVRMRNSNSPLFKNNLDVNVAYNHSQLMDNIKDDLRRKMVNTVERRLYV